MYPASKAVFLGCIAGAISILVFHQTTLQIILLVGPGATGGLSGRCRAAVQRTYGRQHHVLGRGLRRAVWFARAAFGDTERG